MKRSTIWIDGTEYRKEHIEDGRVVYACDRYSWMDRDTPGELCEK